MEMERRDMLMVGEVVRRQNTGYYGDNTCFDGLGNPYRCNSAWYDWGRWALLVVVVLGLIGLFLFMSFLSARRRRRRGLQPHYGTGWSGRTPWGHAPAMYNPNYNDGLQPQNHPTHPNPGWQRTGNSNTGYYGGGYQSSQPTGNGGDWQQPPGYTQESHEMQPPQRAYGNDPRQGGAGDGFVYQAPPGPPPRKN